jgi:hypothetical protein
MLVRKDGNKVYSITMHLYSITIAKFNNFKSFHKTILKSLLEFKLDKYSTLLKYKATKKKKGETKSKP